MGTSRGHVETDVARVPPRRPVGPGRAAPGAPSPDLREWTAQLLARHAAVGLVTGLVRRGSPPELTAHGTADLATGRPVDADTLFRIGSVTKVLTAIAVLQLVEQQAVALDDPVPDHLRTFDLVPGRPGLAPPTLRHLLTHTAGIADVQHVRDLLKVRAGPFGSRPAMPSAPAGHVLPSAARYYRRGLPVVAAPGSTFAYTNHGYATLGQVVEDVSGLRLDHYLDDRVLRPLGMADSGLGRAGPGRATTATGVVVGRRGARAVPDRDWLGPASGGLRSTGRDLARLAAALLDGGLGEHGRVLRPATVSTMVEAHHRPDPRMPGWGLGVASGTVGGHRVVGHDGLLPGFAAALVLAPDDGLALLALTTGAPGAFVWLGAELRDHLRRLLGVPAEEVRTDLPQHPEVWGDLCGTYRLPPRVSDLRGRVALAGGAQVLVRDGRLTLRARVPVAGLRRGLVLHPDDEDDADVLRLDLSPVGMSPARVVFSRDTAGDVAALHLDLGGQPLSLVRTGRHGRG